MNFAVPRRRAIFSQAEAGLTPADLRAAYNIPEHLDGDGETIALLEFGSGYSRSDIDTFAREILGIDHYDIHFVSLGGAQDAAADPADLEATLDIEWALALAPRARIVVYEAPPGGSYQEFARNLVSTLRYAVDDQRFQPSVISISYGDAEQNFAGHDELQAAEEVFAAAAAKEIPVFVASGDQGAYGEHNLNDAKIRRVDFPASCPHAIAVGGTSLKDGAETAWTYYGPANGGATGGGVSSVFDAPDYQASHLEGFSTARRGVPDVAAVADPATGCTVIFDGRRQTVGGTSLAAPVWAGITALVNQALGKKAGFFLPRLYADPSSLRDITAGNNTYNFVQGYPAGPGWDPCTGLGSPDAARLIEQLGHKEEDDLSAGRRRGGPGPAFLLLLVALLLIVPRLWGTPKSV